MRASRSFGIGHNGFDYRALASPDLIAALIMGAVERGKISALAATGTLNFDVATNGIWYLTANAAANWALNIRAAGGKPINALLDIGDFATVATLVTQGGTAYYNNALKIDGVPITPKYVNASPWSAGNANSIDVYLYTIIKTAHATFTVLAAQTRYG